MQNFFLLAIDNFVAQTPVGFQVFVQFLLANHIAQVLREIVLYKLDLNKITQSVQTALTSKEVQCLQCPQDHHAY